MSSDFCYELADHPLTLIDLLRYRFDINPITLLLENSNVISRVDNSNAAQRKAGKG